MTHEPFPGQGRPSEHLRVGHIALANQAVHSGLEAVSSAVIDFMTDLYGPEHRYYIHNNSMLARYDEFVEERDADVDSQAAAEVDKMAIMLHDFVEHGILHYEATAAAINRRAREQSWVHEPVTGKMVRDKALNVLNRIYEGGVDEDKLEIALDYAIDASKWEGAARVWRKSAVRRIEEMRQAGTISEDDASLRIAAVKKTRGLKTTDTALLENSLRNKEAVLLELKLDGISRETVQHNIRGLFIKGLEALDNIANPPEGNPASTYRDCTEALNFFVPALTTLGFKKLASELRGKALEWLVDDPEGRAGRQHADATTYYSEIGETVYGLLQEQFRGSHVDFVSRVKSNGSIRDKLASYRQKGKVVDMVPDGVGFAFVLPDSEGLTREQERERVEQLAKLYRSALLGSAPNIVAAHPVPGEPDYEFEKRDSGYEAAHMTFYYNTEGRPVPFEIQVMSRTQFIKKTYGSWSDLFYKLKKLDPDNSDLHYLEHLRRRSDADRGLDPASTVHSIAERVALAPEFPSVFSRMFTAIDLGGGRALVPALLHGLASRKKNELSDALNLEEGDLALLPPAVVKRVQFDDALRKFGHHLAEDQNIALALSMLDETEMGQKRADGETTVLEGHLLPVGLAALMQINATGKIWESDLKPDEYQSNVVTIALLHDYVENLIETEIGKAGDSAMIAERCSQVLFDIEMKFGPMIRDGVAALTAPMHILDEGSRRERYRQQIQANEYARLIKPLDRAHNHVTDLIRLETGEVKIGTPEHARILEYFNKTDRHLSADFISAELPAIYRWQHTLIWELAKEYGHVPNIRQRG